MGVFLRFSCVAAEGRHVHKWECVTRAQFAGYRAVLCFPCSEGSEEVFDASAKRERSYLYLIGNAPHRLFQILKTVCDCDTLRSALVRHDFPNASLLTTCYLLPGPYTMTSTSTSTSTSSNLLSLIYDAEGPTLQVLDQLLIPHEKKYIDIPSVEAAWSVIREMQIRGAPLIAIVACLGLAVDLNANAETITELNGLDNSNGDVIMEYIEKKMEYLGTSRPTAVNLFNALHELQSILSAVEHKHCNNKTEREILCGAVADHALFMLKRDVRDNKNIGKFGLEAILQHAKDPEQGVRMVTICNTGSLATAGYGTALGVARALQQAGKLQSITALETRPYNQGSRLTAFEIVEEKMPGGRLICDGAAAFLMKKKGVDAVVVGADRCCANGDTANKIGTYNLAIVAKAHNVPFYVASPFTTLDVYLKSGDDIEIEERASHELIGSSRAPETIDCWNPAFDVTPASYITGGIITERGVIEPAGDGTIDVAAFVEQHKHAGETMKERPRLLRKTTSRFTGMSM